MADIVETMVVQLTADIRSMEAGLAQAQVAVAQSERTLGSSAAKAGQAISKGLAMGGVGALALGAAAVAAATSLDKAYGVLSNKTGLVGKDLDGLKQSFQNVASGSGKSFDEIAKTMSTLRATTGVAGSALEQLTKQINVSDRITGGFGITADQVAHAMNNWGQAMGDPSKALDTLFRITQQTGVPMGQLLDQTTTFGPIMREMGYGFDQGAATIAVFGKAGLDAGSIFQGVQMKLKTLASVGITDIPKAMRDTVAAMKAAGSTSEAAALGADLFGRAAGKVAIAARDGSLDIDALVAATTASGGEMMDAAEKTKTWTERFGEFKNKAALALAPVGEKLLPMIERALDFLTRTVQGLTYWWGHLSDGTKKIIVDVGLVLAAFKLLSMNPVIALAALAAALIGATGSLNKLNDDIKTFNAGGWVAQVGQAMPDALKRLTDNGLDPAKTSYGNLKLDLERKLAVGEIDKATYDQLKLDMDAVEKKHLEMKQQIEGQIHTGGIDKPIWKWGDLLPSMWGKDNPFFKLGGAFHDAVAGIQTWVYNWIVHPVWTALQGIWNPIAWTAIGIWKILRAVWNGIVIGLVFIWHELVAAFRLIFGIHSPSSVFGSLFDGLVAIFNFVWNLIALGLNAAWSGLVFLWHIIMDPFLGVLKEIWGPVHAVWSAVWNAIVGIVSSAWRRIAPIVRQGWNAVVDILNGAIDGLNVVLHFVGVREVDHIGHAGTVSERIGDAIGGAFHTGGYVPGTGNTDSVLAALTPGEAIIPADAVRANSVVVASLIAGGHGFHDGGIIQSGKDWMAGHNQGLSGWAMQGLMGLGGNWGSDLAHAFAGMLAGGNTGSDQMLRGLGSKGAHDIGDWLLGASQEGVPSGGPWAWVQMAQALDRAGAWPGWSMGAGGSLHVSIGGVHTSDASKHYQGLAMDLVPSDAAVAALSALPVWWNNERASAGHDHFEWRGGGGAPTGYSTGNPGPMSLADIGMGQYINPPFMVNGAYVPPGKHVLGVLDGPEAALPLSSMPSGGGLGTTVNINVEGSLIRETELFEKAEKWTAKKLRRNITIGTGV